MASRIPHITIRCRGAHEARRGGASTSTLSSAVLAGVLGTVGVVVGPEIIFGGEPLQPLSPREAVHAAALERVAGFLDGALDVVEVETSGISPYRAYLVWRRDDDGDAQVDAGEVAVLSFNFTLQAACVYEPETAVEGTTGPRGPTPVAHASRSASAPTWRAASASFVDRWRADPRVRPTVVAGGVSDLLVSTVKVRDDGVALLRIEITWAGESSDPVDRGAAIVPISRQPAFRESVR